MSKINTEVKATSIKRVNANRENAKKSTGPKTTSGKFRSCRNALKHGLDSRKHLIIGEDIKEFQEMKEKKDFPVHFQKKMTITKTVI
jgi:hypothetical protein